MNTQLFGGGSDNRIEISSTVIVKKIVALIRISPEFLVSGGIKFFLILA